jgi:hypothetical protein
MSRPCRSSLRCCTSCRTKVRHTSLRSRRAQQGRANTTLHTRWSSCSRRTDRCTDAVRVDTDTIRACSSPRRGTCSRRARSCSCPNRCSNTRRCSCSAPNCIPSCSDRSRTCRAHLRRRRGTVRNSARTSPANPPCTGRCSRASRRDTHNCHSCTSCRRSRTLRSASRHWSCPRTCLRRAWACSQDNPRRTCRARTSGCSHRTRRHMPRNSSLA